MSTERVPAREEGRVLRCDAILCDAEVFLKNNEVPSGWETLRGDTRSVDLCPGCINKLVSFLAVQQVPEAD